MNGFQFVPEGFVRNAHLLSVSIVIVSLFVWRPPLIAGQEVNSADQKTTKSLAIHVTEAPKWQDGCLKIAYDVVNQTGNVLWLPINGSRINAAVWSAPQKHGAPAKES